MAVKEKSKSLKKVSTKSALVEEPLVTKSSKVPSKIGRNYKFIVALVIILGILYIFRGLFVAAMVNGKPIFRYSVVKRLEKQGGSGVVEGLVTEKLILQEAKKQGISVLPKDIDAEAAKIEEQLTTQGQDLETLLSAQGMSRSDFNEQLQMQLIVEKIFADDIQISDQDVAAYIEQYTDVFEGMNDEEKVKTAREQLKQQQLTDKFYAWLEELKASAKINYLVEY